jgi:hypothetical protein
VTTYVFGALLCVGGTAALVWAAAPLCRRYWARRVQPLIDDALDVEPAAEPGPIDMTEFEAEFERLVRPEDTR